VQVLVVLAIVEAVVVVEGVQETELPPVPVAAVVMGMLLLLLIKGIIL
jgi:hypothetical protein